METRRARSSNTILMPSPFNCPPLAQELILPLRCARKDSVFPRRRGLGIPTAAAQAGRAAAYLSPSTLVFPPSLCASPYSSSLLVFFFSSFLSLRIPFYPFVLSGDADPLPPRFSVYPSAHPVRWFGVRSPKSGCIPAFCRTILTRCLCAPAVVGASYVIEAECGCVSFTLFSCFRAHSVVFLRERIR